MLDHEETLPHPASGQAQSRCRIISAAPPCVGAMSADPFSAFQVRAHYEVAPIDRGLLHLILRGVRQRAFVVCR